MNEKSYNIYLREVKLACLNVRDAICQENGITDKDQVHIKIRDRNGLVALAAAITHYPESADETYGSRVRNRLVILSGGELQHSVDTTFIFIHSILKSYASRICQKRVTDFLMAEKYLNAAWDYDLQHSVPAEKSNLEYAKSVIAERYSLTFLGGFIFDDKPHVAPNMLAELKSQAFDEKYAFVTEEQNTRFMERKYARDFGCRNDVFIISGPTSFNVETVKDSKQKSMIDVFIQKSKRSETDIIAQLYQSSFVDMPFSKRRRRFVNLKSRNRDMEICPERNLFIKRQFSQIEATTKHVYIMNYFNSNIGNTADRREYYFEQEAWMYRYIWQIDGTIYTQADNICLPDGKMVAIPDAMTDYEFLHKINTVYAALFGFTPEDQLGGKNWLIDSIRRAYTDEGNALYRLAMIDQRVSHIETEREEQKKW